MGRYLFLAALVATVVGSAFTVVLVQHERRDRFVELRQLERERDQMAIDWDRLRLERTALTANDHMERAARTRLDMHVPPADTIVLVTP